MGAFKSSSSSSSSLLNAWMKQCSFLCLMWCKFCASDWETQGENLVSYSSFWSSSSSHHARIEQRTLIWLMRCKFWTSRSKIIPLSYPSSLSSSSSLNAWIKQSFFLCYCDANFEHSDWGNSGRNPCCCIHRFACLIITLWLNVTMMISFLTRGN